jgi:hypothetical protein
LENISPCEFPEIPGHQETAHMKLIKKKLEGEKFGETM